MKFQQLRVAMKRNYFMALFLALAIFITAMYLSVRFRPDGFEMFGINSVPLNTYHDHPAWPSYEVNNREFMLLFRKVFDNPSCRIPVPRVQNGKLLEIPEAEKQTLLAWFGLKLKEIHPNMYIASHEFFGMTVGPENTRVYFLDVLVHRLGAYHGKHLRLVVQKPLRKGYQMQAARLLGEVPEEKIINSVESYDRLNTSVYATVIPVAEMTPQSKS